MSLFQKSVTNKYLNNLDTEKVDKAFENFKKFYGNKLRLLNIMQLKEENYQEGFLREIFVETLGYVINPDENYDLTTEFKNLNDARKADGAIIKNGKAIGVIELKSTKTKNLESIKEQAFGYKNNQPNCKYVITSNFQSLRFYIDNATEFEEFNLFQLDKKQFKLLYLLLSKESIFSDLPEKLKQETKFHENDISDKLYADYKYFKDGIFNNLVKNNSQYDKLTLFKKSQKLLDRFLFVFFAEDSGLIPPNTVNKIIADWRNLKKLNYYQPLYQLFKDYFSYLDKGKKIEDWGEIPAYNGGLFRKDKILDSSDIKIDDEILEKDSLKLATFDFSSEVDVNILGHIFEHSLNEIEEIAAELNGEKIDKSKSKRKKDGIFYTPKYITKYIVENTVGTLCNAKKHELQISSLLINDTYRKKDRKVNENGKKLFNTLNNYKDWLLTLKVLDPACGSGAFLNQTLDFLIAEHKYADDLIAELTGQVLRLHDTDKSILENNIYGVDINEESVEIAKLSLWLRTAQKGRKLSDLSGNIKCGNSLIDDPKVAGDKAFDWDVEFKEIMGKGGFDVVIGNPPYGVNFNKSEKIFLSNFDSLVPDFEIYIYFVSLATDKLLKKGSILSYIFPNTFLSILYGKSYRKKIIENFYLREIVDLSNDNTFVDASVRTCIFTLQNTLSDDYNTIFKKIVNGTNKSIIEINNKNKYFLKQNTDNWLSVLSYNKKEFSIVNKINKNKIVSDFYEVSQGLIPYDKYRGHTPEQIKNRVWHADYKKDDTYKKELKGGDIHRYNLKWNGNLWISYGDWLAAPRKSDFFKLPRLLIREITNDLLYCCYTEEEYYNIPSLINIINKKSDFDLKYSASILNSRLIGWYHNTTSPKAKKGLFPKILVNDVRNLPIKEISQENQQPFIEKANLMLSLNKELQKEKDNFLNTIKEEKDIDKITKKLNTFYDFEYDILKKELAKQKVKLAFGNENDEWREYFNTSKQKINKLQNLINQTDKEIDKMVYDLYELTLEEIEIVENSVK